jgi:hypothetical protein
MIRIRSERASHRRINDARMDWLSPASAALGNPPLVHGYTPDC